jgi:hypothetical protein
LADLVAELRKSGESVPSDVIRDLRSAKTMIEILRMDQSRSQNLLRIEEYLSNVESYLVPVAKRKFGERYADEWVEKVVEAQRSVRACEKKPPARLPVGIPRDKRWVRIMPSVEIPIEKIKQLSEEIGLKHMAQKDGYVLVYGEESKVRIFVNETAKLFPKSGSPSSTIVKNM